MPGSTWPTLKGAVSDVGYRSEVAFAVAFRSEADKDRLMALVPADVRPHLDEMVKYGTDRVTYYEEAIKWYAKRIVGGHDGFEDVEAAEDFLALAEDASSDGTIPSTGVFIRVGEDYDDVEERSWRGDTDPEDALPWPFDLMHISRTAIITSWDSESPDGDGDGR